MIVRRDRGSRQELAVGANPMAGKAIMGIDPGTNILGYGVIRATLQGEVTCEVLGVVNPGKYKDPYRKLKHIFERVSALIREYRPDEVALEAPFYGENVQSMLKLGRAQGVAMAAAAVQDIPIFEYAPKRVKQAITGEGGASKEQVAAVLHKILEIGTTPKEMDATDGLAVALCHYYLRSSLLGEGRNGKRGGRRGESWASFINKNPNKLKP